MSPIRVGVLAGDTMMTWKVRAIERMLAETDAELSLLVREETEGDAADPTKLDRIRSAASEGLWGFYKLPVGKFVENSTYEKLQSVDNIDCFDGVEQRRCQPLDAEGLGQRLPEETVQHIAAETDVVVRDAFGILKGDVLTAPTHGVWSYHGGDIREYRGKPAGFWEFLHGEDEMGVTLQRINETLDGGEIVAFEAADISDADTWQAVKELLYEAEITLLAAGVQNIQDPSFAPKAVEQTGELYTTPGALNTIRYLCKNTLGKLQRSI